MMTMLQLLLLFLFLQEGTLLTTQDCRVHHLLNGSVRHETPQIGFPGRLEVSFWSKGLPPKSFILYLDDDDTAERSVQVFVTSESRVVLRVGEENVSPLSRLVLSPVRSSVTTWNSIVLEYHQENLLVYRPEDRVNVLSAAVRLEGKVTVSVHCRHEMHLAFNCVTGCMVHDASSPLLGTPLGLGPALGFYMSPQSPQGYPRTFRLSPSDHSTPGTTVDASQWKVGKWYRIRTTYKESSGALEQYLQVQNVSYTVSYVEGILWTLHCHPDVAGDDEGLPEDLPEDPSGAGAGEVVAWVLAGLALFVVALLALALCSKVGPQDKTQDFLPSVGVLSQHKQEGNREAEEESEPGSPTLTVSRFSKGL